MVSLSLSGGGGFRGVRGVDHEALAVDVEDPQPFDLVVAVEVAPSQGPAGTLTHLVMSRGPVSSR